MARIERSDLIETLRHALQADGSVRAAWLGGSEATGRVDEYSDIDLCCIVDDERVERAFDTVRAALKSRSPVEIEWRLPSPTWHGHEQAFFRLRDSGPHLLIDTVVIKASSAPQTRFLEVERHGVARVLFDRDGSCAPVPMDRAGHEARMWARLEQVRVKFPILQTIVVRAIERAQPAEAAYAYMNLTLLPLVEVLRMVHCPDRFDYGLRYLDRDLPADVRQAVEGLVLPGGLDGVRRCRERAEAMFEQAVARLAPSLAAAERDG